MMSLMNEIMCTYTLEYMLYSRHALNSWPVKAEGVKYDEFHHHHQLNVHFLPILIKGMDGCFPTALGRQSTFSNLSLMTEIMCIIVYGYTQLVHAKI